MTTTFFYRIQRAKDMARWSKVSAVKGTPKQPEKLEASANMLVFFREVVEEANRIGDDNVLRVPFQRTRKPRKGKSKKAKSA